MKDSFQDSFKVACRSRLLVVRGCLSFAVACRSPGLGSVDRLVVVVCSLENVEKPLVLLHFRSTTLKNHWFYCIFVWKRWKTIGFGKPFSPNIEKTCEKTTFWETIFAIHWKNVWKNNKNEKMLKNHYVFLQNRSKSSTFDENPCRFFRKTKKC